MILTTTQLDELAELYERGHYLTALERSRPLGPLAEWEGTEARVFAGKLASNLGAPRLGRAIHARAWRAAPRHPEACFYYFWSRLARGPWAALRFLDEQTRDLEVDDERRADFAAHRGRALALLRDFERAEACIDEALRLVPASPWLQIERAAVLEAEDRPDEALEACQTALSLRPFYRPAVQATAHRLVQLNRDEEALALLSEATERLESGDVLAQLACLQTELGRHAEARDNFERARARYVLLERDKEMTAWLTARRADAAYHCDDFDAAAQLSAAADTPFHKEMAERLARRPLTGERVLLDVGFVRQHHVTCAPATLSAISRYWSKPIDHLEVAEEICYDGTPSHSERRWAEEHGFVAREFRVTWESSVALLDRGIPFTLTTVGPGAAHLQAVIGYDARRRVLLVRDPNERHFSEYLADEMCQQFASTGPRGMTLLPAEESHRLDGLELPDAELYDRSYEMYVALERHDRAGAERWHAELAATAPEHRLTIHTRAVLAHYDGDQAGMLEAADRMLQLHPDDVNQLLAKVRILRELGRREERLELLGELCGRDKPQPLFWLQYADELSEDNRRHAEAERLLRKALRARPLDGAAYRLLASIRWEAGDRATALELLRFAACLDDKNESHSGAYFSAARHLKRTDEAFRLLADRFARFGDQSSWPARTLITAHEQVDRTTEAMEVLEQALARRPDDDELLLYAADCQARWGRDEEADALLARAEGKSHRTAWLRASAYLALYRNDVPRALEAGRAVLAAEPLDRDMHGLVSTLLADHEGPEAAVTHLRSALERFPHHYSLRVLLIERLGRDDPRVVDEVRRLLEFHPNDVWAHRELAILLAGTERDEALRAAEQALQLDSGDAVSHHIRGTVLERFGRVDEARDEYRRAVRLSVDCEQAIVSLLDLCDTKAQREAELRLIYEELTRQVTLGDGLLTFREYAARTLEPEALLEILREGHAARPDLWHAWAALVRQLRDMERAEEALRVAREATERFPLLPRMALELAEACRAAGDADGEQAAIEQALTVNPHWSEALRRLAELHQTAGRLDEAEGAIRRAVASEPRDVVNQGALADVLWERGDRDAALETMAAAALREPGYEWAWQKLAAWQGELEQPEQVVELARQATREQPDRLGAWLRLACVLEESPEAEAQEECLAALERVLDHSPRHLDAHGRRVDCLAALGRIDEALAACRPEALGAPPPLLLQARLADLEDRRGNRVAAVAAMQSVVTDDPDYAWAWSRLADWKLEAGDNAGYLEAARSLTRCAPHISTAWGYLGDALLRSGDRAAARENFSKALALAPDYSFAGMHLLDIQIEEDDEEAATTTLETIAPHITPAYVHACRARIAALRSQEEAAAELTELCRLESCDADAIEMAASALSDAGHGDLVGDVLRTEVADREANPQVGRAWVDWWWGNSGPEAVQMELKRWARREEVSAPLWSAAAARLLDRLASDGRPADIESFISRHRQRLRQRLETWGAVGHALADVNRSVKSAQWLADWEAREGVEQNMLFPLVLGHWTAGRQAEAVRVGRHAVALPPDHTLPYHRLWLTANCVVEGDVAGADAGFAEIAPQVLNDYYADLHRLLLATRDGLRSSDATAASEMVRTAIAQAAPATAGDSLFRRLALLCRARLATRFGQRLRAAWLRLRARIAW